MKKLSILATLTIVSGIALASPKELAKEKRLQERRDAQMMDAAKKAISYSLVDPDSAKFREVFVAPNQVAICGEVNAKNSFGGYVGFRKFMYSPTKQGIDGDGSYFVEARWEDRCIRGIIASEDKP
jgi:hypothetical protein